MTILDPKKLTAASVTRTPLDTVMAYIAAYNEADDQGMWELMAPDFTRAGASSNWQRMGRDMYQDMSQRWNKGFDDTNWELIDIAVDGATVVCEFYETGTFNRPWPITDDRVIQPNGKTYRARATVWFTVNHAGLINTYRYYTDSGFEQAYRDEIKASGIGDLNTPA